mmetsp:Transcript_5554/g.12863  ORF Transcript_5554/g.12863 Transcript_5554/m.12863 type:complete len:365 (+) Transcript_5554:829-1923(+)
MQLEPVAADVGVLGRRLLFVAAALADDEEDVVEVREQLIVVALHLIRGALAVGDSVPLVVAVLFVDRDDKRPDLMGDDVAARDGRDLIVQGARRGGPAAEPLQGRANRALRVGEPPGRRCVIQHAVEKGPLVEAVVLAGGGVPARVLTAARAADEQLPARLKTRVASNLGRARFGEHVVQRAEEVLEQGRAGARRAVDEEAKVAVNRPDEDEVLADLVLHDVVDEDGLLGLEELVEDHHEELARHDGVLHPRKTLEARRRALRAPEDRVTERVEDEDEACELVVDKTFRIEQHRRDPVEVEDPLPARPVRPERSAEQHELDEASGILRHGEGERVRVDCRDAAEQLDHQEQLEDDVERDALLSL